MAEDLDQQPQPAPDGVGARLTAAREAAGLSRADIAARTKIPERHLIAIEAGDFGALAARTYAVGFSRTYARAVGLDEKEIATAVRAELGDSEPDDDARNAATFEPGDPSRVPSRATAWLAALAAFVVILAGFALWRTYYVPAMTLPSLVGDEPSGEASEAAATQPATAQPAPQGPVTFTATQAGVWVRFYDAAGTRLMEKELALGESYTVPADAQGPMVWTARPDALQVSIGGKPVPPLADRQITMKDVPVSAAALLARGTAPAPAATVPAAPAANAAPTRAVRQAPARQPPRRMRTQATVPSPTDKTAPLPAAVPQPAPPPAAPGAASTDSE